MRTQTSQVITLIIVAILFLVPLANQASYAQAGRNRPTAPDQTNDPYKKKNQRQSPTPTPSTQEPFPSDIVGPLDKQDVVTITANLVNVETTVYHKKAKQLVKNLKKENFAIFEDGVQKDVTNFSSSKAAITVTMVMGYSKLDEIFGYYGEIQTQGRNAQGKFEVIRPVALFLSGFIKPPNDYVSVIAFDLRPTPITDFTNDPGRIQQTINLLLNNYPAFSDSNLFDSLQLALIGGRADSIALDNAKQEKSDYAGMSSIQGRHKAILLVASGLNTMSKINYDQARKIAQNSGVPIYIIQTGIQFSNIFSDSSASDPGRGGTLISGISIDRMTFLQAQNTMKTFAKETGGRYFPLKRLDELPAQLQEINDSLRSQYSLGYNPGDVRDGKQHKIVVKVDVNGDGQFDEKETKDYEISHRRFYNAPK